MSRCDANTRIPWLYVWLPISCPSRAIRCTIPGCCSACRPRMKKVARALAARSASSTRGVVSGDGPSSNVIATTGSWTPAPSITRPNSGAFGEKQPNVNRISALANATSISHATGPIPAATTVASSAAVTPAPSSANSTYRTRTCRFVICASAPPAHEPQIVVLELRGDLGPGVRRDRRPAPLAAHPGPLGGTVELVQQRLREPRGVVGRRDHQPVLAVLHHELEPGDAARDHRPRAAHRLQQHHAERGPIARRAVDICTGVVVRALPVDAAGPVHVVLHRIRHALLVVAAQRPV